MSSLLIPSGTNSQLKNKQNPMSRFAFEDFEFNSHSYSLAQNGVAVPLRPKTARLLALFLANRGKVLSKAEIITAIWESDHVPEYALHQLVSEVRKLAKGKTLIRTQPNQGYCWVAQTQRVEVGCQSRGEPSKPRPLWRYFVGATLAASLTVAFSALLLGDGGQGPSNLPEKRAVEDSGQEPSRLPGIRALANGVIALEEGDPDAAIAWFEFVLAENPQASEARLLLAEGLLQQNRLEEASAYLFPMLGTNGDAAFRPSDYDKMAAAELISRIHQRSGQYFEALEFARQSFFGSEAQCTLEYLDDRIRKLTSLTGEAWSDAPLRPKAELPELESAQISDYQKVCQRLKDHPDQDAASALSPLPAPRTQLAVEAGLRIGVFPSAAGQS